MAQSISYQEKLDRFFMYSLLKVLNNYSINFTDIYASFTAILVKFLLKNILPSYLTGFVLESFTVS